MQASTIDDNGRHVHAGGGIAGDLDFGTSLGNCPASVVAGGIGNGGSVSVTHIGKIMTSGTAADGIFAQSIGGGGGLLGSGSIGAGTSGFAGSAGGTGYGGSVTVTQWGLIETGGAFAHGILAQSAGGIGKGGPVNVVANGSVLAFGLNADGISAESLGASGDGNVSVTVGSGAIVQGGHGSGAGIRIVYGSANTITNYGTITTVDKSGQVSPFAAGVASPMIAALAALRSTPLTLAFDSQIAPPTAIVTATSGLSTAAATTNASSGLAPGSPTSSASPTRATQIVARSTGVGSLAFSKNGPPTNANLASSNRGLSSNPGLSTNVASLATVTFAASTGPLSSASPTQRRTTQIVARSNSFASTVTLSSSSAAPTGASSSAAPAAAASSAAQSSLSVTPAFATSAAAVTDGNVAISANSGTLTINNYGAIVGSIATNGATTTIHNFGAFATGSLLDVGARGTLENDGIISPGGGVSVRQSTITGDFTQGTNSEYLVDLDFAANRADELQLSGHATLGGIVGINVLDIASAAPGTYRETIVDAAGGVTNSGLTLKLPPSAVASFDLSYPSADDVTLGYSIDFARGGHGLSSNQLALGSYLGRIQTAGGGADLASLMTRVIAQPTFAALGATYDAISPAATLPLQSSALLGTLDFSDALLGCGRDDLSSESTNGCNWGRLGDLHRAQTASADTVGFARSSTGFGAGYERSAGDGRWTVGGGLQYDAATLGASGGSSLTGSDVQAGVVVKRKLSAALISGSIVAGAGTYATTRPGSLVDANITSNGTAKLTYGGAHLRAAHAFAGRGTTFAPFVDLGVTRVKVGALAESGGGSLDANLAGRAQTFATAQSGVRVETTKWSHATAFHTSLDASVTQFLGNTQSAASGRFDGAPAGVAPFVLTDRVDRTLFRFVPSLTISQPNRIDVRLGATYEVSARSHGFNPFVQVGKRF